MSNKSKNLNYKLLNQTLVKRVQELTLENSSLRDRLANVRHEKLHQEMLAERSTEQVEQVNPYADDTVFNVMLRPEARVNPMNVIGEDDIHNLAPLNMLDIGHSMSPRFIRSPRHPVLRVIKGSDRPGAPAAHPSAKSAKSPPKLIPDRLAAAAPSARSAKSALGIRPASPRLVRATSPCVSTIHPGVVKCERPTRKAAPPANSLMEPKLNVKMRRPT